jgi:xylulokinase
VGSLTRAAAADLGLPAGMPVVAGCADQAAQAVSNGLMQPGPGSVTLGTGGQVFVPLLHPHTSPDWHTFCHAEPERWYMLGAMLAAGLSLRWLRDTLGLKDAPDAYSTLARLAADVPPGADGLLFLPYLIGERSPLNDPLASGTFVGLALRHERGHLARAIMEGVALALRSIIEAMQARGAAVTQFLAAGNGLASPLWRQIVSDTVGLPLHLAAGREHTGRGAALLAGRGAGVIAAYPPAAVAVGQPLTMPDAARHDFYTGRYALFRETYTRLQPIMHRLNPGGGV